MTAPEEGFCVTALSKIAEFQPRALAYIRANGFVFEDIGTEPGNWQHLAFSLYSELCEANALAVDALEQRAEALSHNADSEAGQ